MILLMKDPPVAGFDAEVRTEVKAKYTARALTLGRSPIPAMGSLLVGPNPNTQTEINTRLVVMATLGQKNIYK